MGVTNVVLIEAKFAENAQTTQYTSTNVRTLIDKFTATNNGAAAATLTVNLVPSAGAAGSGNAIVVSKSLAVGESYTFPELVGHNLAAGGFISTLASAASTLVIRASGRQVT